MSALRRLHRDERAQVSFLAVAAALCFVGLFSMVMNTSDLLRHRIQVQEAADVTALTAATWHARGMNLVAMTNVINSKLLTVTVLSKALDPTFTAVLKIAKAQIAAFQACSAAPFVGVVCAVMATVVRVQESLLKILQKANKPVANKSKCNSSALIFKTMRGIRGAGTTIQTSFPLVATAASSAIAAENYVTGALPAGIATLPGGLITEPTNIDRAAKLPILQGSKGTEDFCRAMKVGGPGYVMEGYKSGQGPMKFGKYIWDIIFIPFFNLFPHPIFYGFHTTYMNEIGCPPGEKYQGGATDDMKLESLQECRDYHSAHGTEATWYRYKAWTPWKSHDRINLSDYTPWRPPDADAGEDPDDPELDELPGLEGKLKEECLLENPGNPEACDSTWGAPPNYNSKFGEENSSYSNKRTVDCDSTQKGYPNLGNKGAPCVVDTGPSCERLKIERSDFRGFGPSDRVGDYYMKSVDIEEDNSDPDNVKYRHEVWIWTLGDAGEADLTEEEKADLVKKRAGASNTPAPTETGCKGLVAPWLFDDLGNGANRLRQMAFVKAELSNSGLGRPFWSGFFDSPPEILTAYAQAQVYNDLANSNYDRMFTQDWRVRLEQASLLSDALGNGDVDASGMFDPSGIGSFLDKVNNH